MSIEKEDTRPIDQFEDWAKCSFCGAYNGKYDRPLEQHRPRCLFKGNADSIDFIVPNYNKIIEEDDIWFLPQIRAQRELIEAKKELEKIKKILENLQNELSKKIICEKKAD